jgi:hypothetical protein
VLLRRIGFGLTRLLDFLGSANWNSRAILRPTITLKPFTIVPVSSSEKK